MHLGTSTAWVWRTERCDGARVFDVFDPQRAVTPQLQRSCILQPSVGAKRLRWVAREI